MPLCASPTATRRTISARGGKRNGGRRLPGAGGPGGQVGGAAPGGVRAGGAGGEGASRSARTAAGASRAARSSPPTSKGCTRRGLQVPQRLSALSCDARSPRRKTGSPAKLFFRPCALRKLISGEAEERNKNVTLSLSGSCGFNGQSQGCPSLRKPPGARSGPAR